MVSGLGTDLVEVDRIASSMQKQTGFRELVFSAGEIAYCEAKANKYEHYAARFAAKEAFFKAIGTGWTGGTSFYEVEIVNNELGKPEMLLLGETAKTIGPLRILVSLTHVKNMASATVIIEK